ncbi:MAG: hypothetical protein EOO05_09780 [Chitinophagaceae bacterium]|nr:MAG: hypothetical protein EOO05_09780 [Chitinophagaceae bacterium]
MLSTLSELLFHPLSNAIMTILSGITALYWIFSFLAGDFLGDMDFAPEVDGGIGVDTDADIDAGEAGGEQSFFSKALEFVNVGKVPFMIVYSVFKFIAWIITLLSSVVFKIADWGWKSALILIPVFIIAFLITRYATKPLVKMYNAMGYNGEEAHDLIGRIARMRSAVTGDKIGAAELVINNDVIRINVKSKSGDPINYNSEVMIADESTDKRYYYVVPEITLNNIL